jgi:hypothetical protein
MALPGQWALSPNSQEVARKHRAAARRLRLQLFDACQRVAVVVSFGVESISKHQSFPQKRESSL